MAAPISVTTTDMDSLTAQARSGQTYVGDFVFQPKSGNQTVIVMAVAAVAVAFLMMRGRK